MRRKRLARLATATLLSGLALAGAIATVLTLALRATGILASGAGGALLVLAVNLVLLIISGTVALLTQRWLVRRQR